jgi:hypothetical protein
MTEVATAPSELPEPSPLGAVAGVFVRPRETFESMRSHPRYWLPLALVVAAQIAFSMLVLQSGAVANDAVAKAEAKGAPPEQIEHMRTFFESPAAPLIVGVGGLVTMAFIILLGVGNLLGDDIGPFGRILDAATDPFILWSTAVVALGISVYARKKFTFGLIAVLPMFLIGLILSAMR